VTTHPSQEKGQTPFLLQQPAVTWEIWGLALPHSLRQALGQVVESRRYWLLGATSRLLVDGAIAIVVVIGVVFADLIADLLYAAVNPRIRYK